MSKRNEPKTLKPTQINQVVDIIRRRAYWREIGEVLLLGVYKPEGFFDLQQRAQPYSGKAGKPLTLGEVLKRLPKEYQEKVLGLDVDWLIGLLAPPVGDDPVSYQATQFRPRIELILRPDDANRLHAFQQEIGPGIEVEPPRILDLPRGVSASAKPKAKAKVKKDAKKATGKAHKKAPKKAPGQTATAKKVPKKKPQVAVRPARTNGEPTAAATMKEGSKRRSMADLEGLLLRQSAMVDEGLTRAQIRSRLACSGDQVNRLLDGMKGRLVSTGEGRMEKYRIVSGVLQTSLLDQDAGTEADA